MQTDQDIKDLVRHKYAEIAGQERGTNAASCCGAGGCGTEVTNIMTDSYDRLEGYNPDADLGLGCGLPTEFARIRPGDTVVDLGSGAGNDCFVARAETGSGGQVIGVDFTDVMIAKARANAEKLGFDNVTFVQGDIEDIPLDDNTADVVVSNCVLNLVPDKSKAFAEMYRIIKPGGHFSVSDIVLNGVLPDKLRNAAEMYAGCVAGAMQQDDYLATLQTTGFQGITIQKAKEISIPDDILGNYLSAGEIVDFRNASGMIMSITVYGEKPAGASS